MSKRIIPTNDIFAKCLDDILSAGKRTKRRSIIEEQQFCPTEAQFARFSHNVKN
jgi:hypothetical protein